MEKIKEILNVALKSMNLFVYDITFNDNILEVTVDSDVKVVDLNTVVEATKVISPLLDEHDFIKDSYVLNVVSKEKGGEVK